MNLIQDFPNRWSLSSPDPIKKSNLVPGNNSALLKQFVLFEIEMIQENVSWFKSRAIGIKVKVEIYNIKEEKKESGIGLHFYIIKNNQKRLITTHKI
jgi:hypothetical protein